MISPLLFKVSGEYILGIVWSNMPEHSGKVIGGRAVWNILYADDTILIGNTRSEIVDMAEHLRQASLNMGFISKVQKHQQ